MQQKKKWLCALFSGKKVFGIGTDYLKLSAILPSGAYSAGLVPKAEEQMVELSLRGESDGNAEIDFMENQFHGLTELLCKKSDGTYDAVSLKLKSYQTGDGAWTDFEEQEMKLQGTEKISFRFVPFSEDEKIPESFEAYETAELLFHLLYEGDERELHADGKTGAVILTGIGGTSAADYHAKEFTPAEYKANNKAAKVAEAFMFGMFRSGYADLDTGITISYVDYEYGTDQISNRMLPDGVRIYRSSDNKKFQKMADLLYKKGETQIEFQDSGVWLGETYYYKAKNFTNSKNGKKVFSDAMKSSLPFYAQYSGGRYHFQHMNPVEGKMTGTDLSTPQIFRIQGLSSGNPALILNASQETGVVAHEKTEGYNAILDEQITEYSFDGTVWIKMPKSGKKLLLLPKQTVYLKLGTVNN